MDYKKMSYISGVIIFFSFLILMMSIIWLAEKRIFFTRDYIVYVKFDDVVGLRDHSQVFMRGYRIGWTKGVKFLKDGVLVRVDVNKKYDVPTDSRWEINTLNFMGEKAITVQPGKKDLFLQPGAEVPGYNRDLISVTVRARVATAARVGRRRRVIRRRAGRCGSCAGRPRTLRPATPRRS